MKYNLETINGLLYLRVRRCIWDHWKTTENQDEKSDKAQDSQKRYIRGGKQRPRFVFHFNLSAVKSALTKERLICVEFCDLSNAYQSVHVNC